MENHIKSENELWRIERKRSMLYLENTSCGLWSRSFGASSSSSSSSLSKTRYLQSSYSKSLDPLITMLLTLQTTPRISRYHPSLQSVSLANAGQRSINNLIHHNIPDRLSSKKQMRALMFWLGRPIMQYHPELWSNRLRAYRAETLGEDLSVFPTGEAIKRFLKFHRRHDSG